MKYLVHTIHRDSFVVEADDIIFGDGMVLFVADKPVDGEAVVSAIRYDHFKSADKMETLH